MARRSDHTRPELTQMALDAARKIVVNEGINALSARKITTEIGYTVGTLYQLFTDMDDLVERLNAETLAALYEHCEKGATEEQVADKLRAFGMLFGEFARAHGNEWDAIMSYRFKPGHEMSDFYGFEIKRLFDLLRGATQEFYGHDESEKHDADLEVLWASLTGILAVAHSERNFGGSVEEMLDRLIQMYIAARS